MHITITMPDTSSAIVAFDPMLEKNIGVGEGTIMLSGITLYGEKVNVTLSTIDLVTILLMMEEQNNRDNLSNAIAEKAHAAG